MDNYRVIHFCDDYSVESWGMRISMIGFKVRGTGCQFSESYNVSWWSREGDECMQCVMVNSCSSSSSNSNSSNNNNVVKMEIFLTSYDSLNWGWLTVWNAMVRCFIYFTCSNGRETGQVVEQSIYVKFTFWLIWINLFLGLFNPQLSVSEKLVTF